MLLASDTYTVTAVAYGYLANTISGVSVVSGTTATLNIPLTSAPSYTISGTVTDATTGWPLYAKLQISGDPLAPPTPELWTDPVTGGYSLTLASGITHTINVDGWLDGYNAASRVQSSPTKNPAPLGQSRRGHEEGAYDQTGHRSGQHRNGKYRDCSQ